MIAELLNVDLIQELGLEGLPRDRQQKLLEQMAHVIEDRLMSRLLGELSEEAKLDLDAVLNADGDVTAFLKSKISNIDIITAEVIAEFKQEMMDLNQQARAAVRETAADNA